MNKAYAKRYKETHAISRTLWPTGDPRIEGKLPLYMIRARVRHKMEKFLSDHKDHTLLVDTKQ